MRKAVLIGLVASAAVVALSGAALAQSAAPAWRFSTVPWLASTSTTVQRVPFREAMAVTARCSLGETS